MSDGLLTEEEVKSYLEVNEAEIERLKHKGKLTAFRVGGAYMRYRKDEVTALRSGRKFQMPDHFERSWINVAQDFFTFYGVYLILFLELP